MALPEIFTPGHAAANLRLFVETCAERSAELITAAENRDADGRPLVIDSLENEERMLCFAMSTQLKEGQHHWFSPEVCDDIGDKLPDMPQDVWEKTYSAPVDWTLLQGAVFMSFAKPFAVDRIGKYRVEQGPPGPLLGAALLPSGYIGFLSSQVTLDGKDQPLLKFMQWPNGESWSDLASGHGQSRLQDAETLQWGAGVVVAMFRGMVGDLQHYEMQLPEHAHTRFMLMPTGGMFEVVLPDLRPYFIDGDTQYRQN